MDATGYFPFSEDGEIAVSAEQVLVLPLSRNMYMQGTYGHTRYAKTLPFFFFVVYTVRDGAKIWCIFSAKFPVVFGLPGFLGAHAGGSRE
jgi:hypothetical protein